MENKKDSRKTALLITGVSLAIGIYYLIPLIFFDIIKKYDNLDGITVFVVVISFFVFIGSLVNLSESYKPTEEEKREKANKVKVKAKEQVCKLKGVGLTENITVNYIKGFCPFCNNYCTKKEPSPRFISVFSALRCDYCKSLWSPPLTKRQIYLVILSTFLLFCVVSVMVFLVQIDISNAYRESSVGAAVFPLVIFMVGLGTCFWLTCIETNSVRVFEKPRAKICSGVGPENLPSLKESLVRHLKNLQVVRPSLLTNFWRKGPIDKISGALATAEAIINTVQEEVVRITKHVRGIKSLDVTIDISDWFDGVMHDGPEQHIIVVLARNFQNGGGDVILHHVVRTGEESFEFAYMYD